PTPADALSPTTEKGPSSIESVVTSVTEAIERSVRAEFTPAAGAPIDIRVTLPGEALGLAGLRIILTKTTLDVVLDRTRSTPSDQLLRAARALADRLMTRFSKKTVRILEIPAPAEQSSGENKNADAASLRPNS